jgi:glutamate dehydrogenase (NAD(P)+)
MLDLIDEWGPEKIVCVSDTRTGMRGVLVIDNTARGMGKGGTRMGPGVTVAEIARLARVMTWKWAACDLFFGGAKAGIVADPAAAGKEAVLRAFARALAREIPDEYVAGLDMGLTEADAAIVQDELADRGAAIGVPAELGGVPIDKLGFAGFGAAEAASEACAFADFPLAGARVAIQGFGAVGASAARRVSELGAVVVAVSTVRGGIHDPNGLDVDGLLKLRAEHGDECTTRYDGRSLEAGDELTVAAEVLIPAARQDVIDEVRAAELPARLVVEAANLPLTPGARRVLAERRITVVPDFIANAGGVIAGAYAMEARRSPFRPDPDVIFAAVSKKIRTNTVDVLRTARMRQQTPHEAARVLAEERVRTAMELRGRLPRRAGAGA